MRISLMSSGVRPLALMRLTSGAIVHQFVEARSNFQHLCLRPEVLVGLAISGLRRGTMPGLEFLGQTKIDDCRRRVEFPGRFQYDYAMAYYGNSQTVFFGGPLTRTVKTLIIANVAVYLLQVAEQVIGTNVLELYFGLIPRRVTQEFMVWQFVTYMFLHGGIFHLVFNMLTLFMFGNELERYWGARRFLN